MQCDRQQPCAHCIARKVPELCHAYQPGKGEGDLHIRLARVEQILEMALPQFASPGSPGGSVEPSNNGFSLPPQPQHGHHDRRHRDHSSPSSHSHDESTKDDKEEEIPNNVGTLEENGGPFYGATALGSVNSTPILEKVQHAPLLLCFVCTPVGPIAFGGYVVPCRTTPNSRRGRRSSRETPRTRSRLRRTTTQTRRAHSGTPAKVVLR